jgi:ribosomal protein L40E
MEVTLREIMNHSGHYKWCRACQCWNHVDNDECHHCGSSDFTFNIETQIKEEVDFQAWHQGLEPHEAYITVR